MDSVVCLIERDCDTTVGDSNTYLAAHLAAKYNKVDCLKFLVKQGTALDAIQAEGKACSHIVSIRYMLLSKYSKENVFEFVVF